MVVRKPAKMTLKMVPMTSRERPAHPGDGNRFLIKVQLFAPGNYTHIKSSKLD
jgi:hypothetical protein